MRQAAGLTVMARLLVAIGVQTTWATKKSSNHPAGRLVKGYNPYSKVNVRVRKFSIQGFESLDVL